MNKEQQKLYDELVIKTKAELIQLIIDLLTTTSTNLEEQK